MKLVLGNEAIARGLYEAGVKVVSSYPGTPSTEITEYAATYNEMKCEWAPNEKVALEVAVGASIGGARSFAGMKHVGLNVAADPLFTAAYTGVNGGLVIAVADDPGMHSSQNEQDSRYYAKASKTLMLEPSDSSECVSFTKKAFELSEKFDTPVFIRLSTRISHSRGIIEETDRNEAGVKDYVKDAAKYVMMPSNARGRHIIVEKKLEAVREYAESTELNKIEYNSKEIGIVASGIAYQNAKEAMGNKASYLKLGMVCPLPKKLIEEFASKVKTLYVIEELEPFFEEYIKTLGLKVIGKEMFSICGELSAQLIKEKLLNEKEQSVSVDISTPVRPPVLCPGCPHRGTFYMLKKLKLTVSGDIGCYTLGANAPLSAMDITLCMGASISGLHGFNKARAELGSEQNTVAVIGDSTFIHSGITGLINIAYNNSNSTVLILDNSTTGMTGHQQNPSTGYNIKNEPATAVDIPLLCKAVGINRVFTVDPFDVSGLEILLKEELAYPAPSVIIVKRPCALLKSVKAQPVMKIDKDNCKNCKVCMKIGCPCITAGESNPEINADLCVGCGLCKSICKFNAIN